jgi:DNA-binding response OmpR family regulator
MNVTVGEVTPTRVITTGEQPAEMLALGTLRIDRDRYQAVLRGRVLQLSRSQLDLLTLLVENRHHVLSRDDLSSALGFMRGRSVDVLLTSLRAVLGQEFVRNVRSRGWILEPGAFES